MKQQFNSHKHRILLQTLDPNESRSPQGGISCGAPKISSLAESVGAQMAIFCRVREVSKFEINFQGMFLFLKPLL